MIEETRIEYGDSGPDGANMIGFILWVQERWREFNKLFGRQHKDGHTDAEHKQFDRWLDS